MTRGEVSGSMERLQPKRYHLGTLEQHGQRVCEGQGEGVSQMVPSKASSTWLQTMTVCQTGSVSLWSESEITWKDSSELKMA